MIKNNLFYLLICFVLWPGWLVSQSLFCGTDKMHELLLQKQPSLFTSESNANRVIYNSVVSGEHQDQKLNGVIYTIPVVFHIMHNNGPENVSDSIVQLAVNEINLRFQNASPYFDSTGHPVNVQFCLATIDPQGNATTGITRHETMLTYFQLTTIDDINLKNIARWSPDLYYNIYVVNNISGFIDGYSTFPYNAGEPADGVVIEFTYIYNSFLLAHETGHYCGLYHTFQNGCYNQNCLLNGDNVCDTPPDNTSQNFTCQGNSCTTEMDDTSGFNPFTMDMNELPNYMDYTTCPFSFSQGQADRMEISVAQLRSNLALSNGCGTNPGQAAPLAGFNFTISPCNNGEVTFSDSTSINSITTEWDLDNDGLFEFLGHDFTYTFPASGTYTVKQRVNGIGGQDTLSKSLIIHKGTLPNFPINIGSTAIIDTLRFCQGESVIIQGVGGGVSYLWSTGETTQLISFAADTSFELNLIMTDSLGFTWSTLCTPIYIKVNPYQLPAIAYTDSVAYYCEGSPVQLFVTNPIPGNYQWFQYTVPIGWTNTGVVDTIYTAYPGPTYSSFYYVIYSNVDSSCTGQSNQITLQSQYLPLTPGYLLNVNGTTMSYPVTNYIYQWYFNGLPIPNANTNSYTATQTGCYNVGAGLNPFVLCESLSDTVCYSFTGVKDFQSDEFEIYPNPAKDLMYIKSKDPLISNFDLKVFNIQGKEIQSSNYKIRHNKDLLTLDILGIESGIYILKINYQGRSVFEKLNIIK